MFDRRFQRLYPPATVPEGPAHWLLFRGDEPVVGPAGAFLQGDSSGPAGFPAVEPLLLGLLDGQPCLANRIPSDTPLPDGYTAMNLRVLMAQSEADLGALAGYAFQLLAWERTTRFCSVCAQPLGRLEGTWGRVCAGCNHSLYPPVSPAVIVLIHDDADGALLTTKPGWGRRYSLVAGFVEPGETFEACVMREVREEVGVEVDQLRYVSSQAWPFPHQIMVGFLARYAGGEIAIDTTELADAAWFTRDNLPELPPPHTISRHIIELWRSAKNDASAQ